MVNNLLAFLRDCNSRPGVALTRREQFCKGLIQVIHERMCAVQGPETSLSKSQNKAQCIQFHFGLHLIFLVDVSYLPYSHLTLKSIRSGIIKHISFL